MLPIPVLRLDHNSIMVCKLYLSNCGRLLIHSHHDPCTRFTVGHKVALQFQISTHVGKSDPIRSQFGLSATTFSSGKCTLSPGCPRTAQDVLETQRHQKYKAPQVAPRARSKMLTSLRHPGSLLGHPEPSWAILSHPGPPLDMSLAIFGCLSYFNHFAKFRYMK